MSTINARLKSLQPYVIGLRFSKGIAVIDTILKDKWVVPENEIIKIGIKKEKPNYYMFYSEVESVGVDELLDYIEYSIGVNIEKEKKEVLLKEKIKELELLFSEEPLERLENLLFIIDEPIMSPPIQEIPEGTLYNVGKMVPPPQENNANEIVVKEEVNTVPGDGKCNCLPENFCDICMEEKGY
jgi:hypothetical protein